MNEEMRWKLAELLDELAKMVSALDEIVRYLSLHAMQAEFIDVKKPLEQKIFNFDNH